jgi:branched-subunit amino acid aminotransferase/4-amino-4-deoxychorismate lyase
MTEIVFLNGEFVPAADARISIYDGGFLHGAGLFETMRADFGKVFRLTEHIDRMLNSAAKLGLPIERPDLPLPGDFDELIQRNNLVTARLRMTVTVGALHTTTPADAPSLTVCVTAADLQPPPADLLVRGMSVLITTFTQSNADPMAGHKTIAYLPRLLALRSAQKLGCSEALWFTPQNYLAEGCISSVFIVRGGALATPPLNTPVLPGVSRSVVLEIAAAEGIPAEEKALNINDVLDADEIFITNSSLQVAPVCRVEKKDIGTGKPGPMTARIRGAFQDVVKHECGSGSDASRT